MTSILLYATPHNLYAMSRDGQVFRVPVGAPDSIMDAALVDTTAWLRSKSGFGAKVELLLASSLVRFTTVPWISGTFTTNALRRQVERSLFERCGEDPREWQLRIQWPRYGWSTFAIAYPARLLAAAAESLLEAGLSLDSTAASAIAVVSRYKQNMPPRAAFVGFQEDDGLTGVHLQDGGIAEVECVPREGYGLDASDVWSSRKRFEFSEPGQLHWLQAAHCPSAFEGAALTADGSGSCCASTDLLMAINR